MGTPDNYGGVQLHAGNACCKERKIGEGVPIPDGAYLGYTGLAIIEDGKLWKVYKRIFDSDGIEINWENLLKAT